MKWIANIFKANFKIYTSKTGTWVFLIIAIIISLIPLYTTDYDFAQVSSKIKIVFVNEDDGAISLQFIEALYDNEDYGILLTDNQEAFHLLEKGQVEAVFILKSDFTSKLSKGEFDGIVEPYYSPSSNAKATISEPVLNSVLMYWIEEFVIQQTQEFLQKKGVHYSKEDEQSQRKNIEQLWDESMSLEIRSSLDNEDSLLVADTLPEIGLSAKWYAAISAFFIFISSNYSVAILKKGLASRLILAGAKIWQLILGIILPILLISMIGWFMIVIFYVVFADIEVVKCILLSSSILAYLISLSALSSIFMIAIKNITIIMLLAPMFTFINAVLGELIITLPQWALFLQRVAFFLPGRWINLAVDSIYAQGYMQVGVFICCIIYMLILFLFIQCISSIKIAL
jgi:hypothetical protein